NGTAGNGTDSNYGVIVSEANTEVSTAGGDPSITRTRKGSASFNPPITIENNALGSAPGPAPPNLPAPRPPPPPPTPTHPTAAAPPPPAPAVRESWCPPPAWSARTARAC